MPAACEWAHRVGYKSVNANSLWRSGTVQRTRFLCPHTTACGVVRTLFESNLWQLKLVRSCAFFESNLEAPVRKVLFTHKTRTHQLRIIRAKLDIQVKKIRISLFVIYFSHKGNFFRPCHQRCRSDVHAHQELYGWGL